MPPKKAKITIKKEDNIKDDKIKKLKLDESSLKSTDDDSISQDEIETFSDGDGDGDGDGDNDIIQTENLEEEIVEEETEVNEEESVKDNEDEEVNDDDDCMYRKAKVKNLDEDGDDEDGEDFEEVYDDDNINYNEVVKPEDRITKPFMTIFERVRLLGDRAKQLSLGAKPMIQGIETMNPKEIAKLELEKGVIPLIIERPLPNGKKERWYVNELKIMN